MVRESVGRDVVCPFIIRSVVIFERPYAASSDCPDQGTPGGVAVLWLRVEYLFQCSRLQCTAPVASTQR